MKTPALLLATLGFGNITGHALSWQKTGVDTALESGRACSVAIDRAGRVHTTWIEGPAADTAVWYAVRPNATAGFITKTLLWSIQSEPANLTAKNVSIDIGPDLKPQIAIAFTNGRVVVTDATLTSVWSPGVIASTSSFGGISLVAAGNGFPNNALAYTAPDGRARYVEQTGPATWSPPVDITNAANTGFHPKLVSSAKGQAFALVRSYLCYTYNDTAKRVQVSAADTLSSGWLAPVVIETNAAASFSSIDADSLRGKQGVTYVVTTDTTSTVRYASRTTGAWSVQSSSTASELESSTAQSFSTPALRFDAGGNPIIAYSRNLFNLSDNGTLDIRTRRLIPGGVWELSIVDTVTGGGIYQTNGLALAASPAGDPALVYEKDPGADNSTFTFARPISAPWVTAVPDELTSGIFAGSMAPALGHGPDGAHYLVASPIVSGSAGFAGPVLFSYRNGTVSSLALTGSSNPYVENAITVTPDGTVHVVSLRLPDSNLTSTAGDLFYYRIRNGALVFSYLVNVGSPQNDIASPGQLSLGHDGAGALYLAFRNPSGGMTLTKLPANTPPYGFGETPWQTLLTVAGNLTGIDLAVRPDGAAAVSYYNTAARTVNLTTDVDLSNVVNAGRLPAFTSGPVYTVPGADAEPRNTSVDLQAGERPAVAWGSGGRLRYAKWQFNIFGGSATIPVTEIDNGYLSPDVQLLRTGSTLYFGLYDNTAGGRFTWLESSAGTPSSIRRQSFAAPGISLSANGGGRLAVTLDQHQFPVLAAGTAFLNFITFNTTRSIFLARPGDAMDYDNDGASLLEEGAYGLNPAVADAQLLPQPFLGSFSSFPESYTAFDAAHRTPDVPATTAPAGVEKHGEFTYSPELSSSLTSWSTPVFGSGLTSGTRLVLLPPTLPAGVVMKYPQVRISAAYQTANPRMFFRHTVQRDR